MKNQYKYWAFISYKREDEKWAKWLQKKLEYYKLPVEILADNPNLSQYLRPVFKDTTDLNGNTLLGSINAALDSSMYLIVICSPNALISYWVSQEVQYFIDKGKEKYIIPVVVDGKPFSSDPALECLPECLRNLRGDEELLCVNIDDDGRDAAVSRIVSRITGISFDSLWQRFKHAERMRNNLKLLVMSALMIVACAISLLFVLKNKQISEQNWQILKTQSVAVADLANRLADNGDAFTAAMLALEVLPDDLDNPNRPYTAEGEYSLRNAGSSRSGLFKGHRDRAYSATMTRDGRRLISGSADSTIRVWDTRNGECLSVMSGHKDIVRYVELSPDESILMSWDFTDSIRMWDMQTMKNTHIVDCSAKDGELVYARFSKDGKNVVTFQGNTVYVWDIYSGQCMNSTVLQMKASIFNDCLCIGDKYVLIRLRSNQKIVLFDRISGEVHRVFDGINADFDSREECIALLDNSGKIRIYDLQSGKTLMELEEDTHNDMMVFSPDGKKLALASRTLRFGSAYYSTIEVFQMDDGVKVATFSGHSMPLEEIRWSHDSNFVLTSSSDMSVGMWYVGEENYKDVALIDLAISGWPSIARYSPTGRKMVYSIKDTIKVKSVGIDETCLVVLENHQPDEYFLTDLVFSNDDRMIFGTFNLSFFSESLSQSSPSILKFWDSDNGKLISSIDFEYKIACITFSADNKMLAVGTRQPWVAKETPDGIAVGPDTEAHNCDIYMWNIWKEWSLIKLPGHTRDVNSIIFTEDCMKLISCSDDASIIVWDAETGEVDKKLVGHSGPVRAISLASDNVHLISCSEDKTIRVWNVNSGDCEKVINAHHHRINSLVMSNDKRLFASMSNDNTIKVWSTDTFQSLYTIITTQATEMSYGTGDKYFYVADSVGDIHVYDVASGGCVALYHGVGTALSCHPFKESVLCTGSRGVVQLDIEPLQGLIDSAQVQYKHRQLTDQERKEYYLSPRDRVF